MDKAPMFKKAFVELVEIKEEPPDEDAAGNEKTKRVAKPADRTGRRRHDSGIFPMKLHFLALEISFLSSLYLLQFIFRR